MARSEVTVPDIGGAEGAEVIEVLVAVGDDVEIDQGLIVLESDKASMEIPCTVAGKVAELLVAEGDRLSEGSPVVVVEHGGGEAPEGGAPETAPAAQGESTEPAQPVQAAAADGTASSSASVPAPAPESAAPGDGQSAETEIVTVPVPDIGTSDAVQLIELCVAVGERVEENSSLVVLESDKASMEVPSPAAGEVVELLVSEGQEVKQGDVLLRLRSDAPVGSGLAADTASAAGPSAQSQPTPASEDGPAAITPEARASQASAPEPAASPTGGAAHGASREPGAETAPSEPVYAGPAVRKLARELGVALDQVTGSGPRGRILKEDLQAHVRSSLAGGMAASAAEPAGAFGIPPVPEVDFAAFGDIETVQRSSLEKLVARNMQRSWLNVPHVTQRDEVDISELETFRKSLRDEADRRELKLTPMPFLLAAVARALREHPKFRSSLAHGGEALVHKRYCHIGMAVDTPAGLLVPVLRDVDQKSVWQIAEEASDLANRARARKLKPEEMQGGCFTVSSLGSIGGTGFTPIVNVPEVAILGVSRAQVKPVWTGEAFEPRTMLPVALSYDHRVINGGDGGRFLQTLTSLLADIRRLIL